MCQLQTAVPTKSLLPLPVHVQRHNAGLQPEQQADGRYAGTGLARAKPAPRKRMILPFGRTRYNQIDLMKKAILIRAFRGELMGQVHN